MRFLRVFSIKSVPEDRMIRIPGQCVLLHREPPQKLAAVNSNQPCCQATTPQSHCGPLYTRENCCSFSLRLLIAFPIILQDLEPNPR